MHDQDYIIKLLQTPPSYSSAERAVSDIIVSTALLDDVDEMAKIDGSSRY